MRYHIAGSDRRTGADVELVTEAPDPSHAQKYANDRGILVREITPLNPTPPAPTPVIEGPAVSALAKASLWLGIPGTCCFPLGIAAIIVGAFGVKEIHASGGRISGKGIAVTGITLGVLGLLLTAIALVIPSGAPSLSAPTEVSPQAPTGHATPSEGAVPSSSSSEAKSRRSGTDAWYEGGTLHKATMAQWNEASYADRLATCADFIAGLKKDGKVISSVDALRPDAVALERCITEAGRGGHADTETVTTIAAACYILMNK